MAVSVARASARLPQPIPRKMTLGKIAREMALAKKDIDELNKLIEDARLELINANRRYAKAHYEFRQITQSQPA